MIMEKRFEEAVKRVNENNLMDLLFYKKYSDDENLQKAFLDGYAIGVLSSLLITASPHGANSGDNTALLQRAINGDKDAIDELECLMNNEK